MKLLYKIFIFVFLFIAVLSNIISSNYIAKHYSNVPQACDIVLNQIENTYSWAMKLAEILIVISIITFAYVVYKNKKEIYKWIFITASFFLMRGLLLPLTIMGNLNPLSLLNKYETFSYGMFPSGHIAIPYLFLLFSYKKNKLWIFYLVATLSTGLLLILGKQHYTIDIISTIFIGYAIKSFTEKHIFKEKNEL